MITFSVATNESKLSRYRAHLLGVAKEACIGIDFSKRAHYYNTHKAHLLLHVSEAFINRTINAARAKKTKG